MGLGVEDSLCNGVGRVVGKALDVTLRDNVGPLVGDIVGLVVGDSLGDVVGLVVGDSLGDDVGHGVGG